MFVVRNLPYLFLILAISTLFIRFWAVHYWLNQEAVRNSNNVHLVISLIFEIVLGLQILAIFVDLGLKQYATFKYSVVLEVTSLSCAIFLTGYIFFYFGEIFFAWIGDFNTCRRVGLGTEIVVDENEAAMGNVTITEGPDLEEVCHLYLRNAIIRMSVDILVNIIYILSSLVLLRYTWDFMKIKRPRPEQN
ncbi:unnamed protein product [Caenorhabditis angaria]|uniref:Uncharacterized protein n=1 Tax=Caenorhabditis angaria TaxID=860376 RepID=A0A9P1IDF6_9PELO|nr:unnamed protein product [Caenorhabditis angaria]